jgi:hypothetical protein
MSRVIIENDKIVGWSTDPRIGTLLPAEVRREGTDNYEIKNGEFIRKPEAELQAKKATEEAKIKEKKDKNDSLKATARDKKAKAEDRIDALVELLVGA